MPVSADYRRLLRRENKIYSIILKSFKTQQKFLEDNLEILYTKYPTNISVAYTYLENVMNIYPKKWRETEIAEEPLWWFWREMWVYKMIQDMKSQIQKSTEKWYKKRYRVFQPKLIGVWIEFHDTLPKEYADKRENLQLSNYKWTISHTTKYDVIKALKEWIDTNKTRWEVSKDIEAISTTLFSKWRARTIAVTEMWKAYEYWNYVPMQELADKWYKVKKFWLTCRDAKVRPEHAECEALGRVDLAYVYPSVWTDIPPGWVNCRCTIEYDFDL